MMMTKGKPIGMPKPDFFMTKAIPNMIPKGFMGKMPPVSVTVGRNQMRLNPGPIVRPSPLERASSP